MIPKKILFISSSVTYELMKSGIAGGEVRLSEIMKEFIRKRWEVHFLSNGGGDLFSKIFKLNKVINHSFSIKQGETRLSFIIFTIKTIFNFPKELKSFNGYIYTANELLFDVIPALELKKSNKMNKWVAIAHWMPPIKFWKRKKSGIITSLLFLLGENISVFLIKYFADIVLAVSENTRKQLINFGLEEKNVLSVKCGVEQNKINKIQKEKIYKIYDAVFMKRIQAVKGVFDLIKIWKIVTIKNKKVKLAIIGGGIDNKEVRNLIKISHLENNISFLGPIFNFKKKIIILSQSRMFILPSYEENWAIVMGEAMACKIPVLAYDLPELIDVWKESFVPIPLGNKEKFAEEIIRYLEDERLREKQAEKGYKYVQQFDWKKIAEREMQIIENI